MKIFNRVIIFISIIMIFLGYFNGTIAFQSEIDKIIKYKSDYSMYSKSYILFLFLIFRYLKYILIIQFFTYGNLGKFCIPTISMYKSYEYGFVIGLMINSFTGFELYKKLLFVIFQMTASLIITIIFSCISMNNINKSPFKKNNVKVQYYSFVFCLICCIIISMIDFILISVT